MQPVDIVGVVAERLEALGLPWMLVGSHASSIWGAYRATHDVDVVVVFGECDIPRIVAAFQADFYVDDKMLEDNVHRGIVSNIIHFDTNQKADLWPLKENEYDRTALQRRVRTLSGDTEVWVATPEDTVLSKLRWAEASGSEMQLHDAAMVLRVRKNLDLQYMRRWAAVIGVSEKLEELLAEAQDESHG